MFICLNLCGYDDFLALYERVFTCKQNLPQFKKPRLSNLITTRAWFSEMCLDRLLEKVRLQFSWCAYFNFFLWYFKGELRQNHNISNWTSRTCTSSPFPGSAGIVSAVTWSNILQSEVRLYKNSNWPYLRRLAVLFIKRFSGNANKI